MMLYKDVDWHLCLGVLPMLPREHFEKKMVQSGAFWAFQITLLSTYYQP